MYSQAEQTAFSGGLQTRNIGGTLGQQLQPPPPRDTIQQALSEQDKVAQELHTIVSHLEERLHPVLGPTLQTNTNAEVAPNPSAILDRVRSNTRALNGVGARLSELLQRLQL